MDEFTYTGFNSDISLALTQVEDCKLREFCRNWLDKFLFLNNDSKLTYSEFLRLGVPSPLFLIVFKLLRRKHCIVDEDSIVTFEVPDGVSFVPSICFSYLYSLKEVYLPDSVTELTYGDFMHCSSLKGIRLSVNLSKVGIAVFEGTSLDGLELHYYPERNFAFYKNILIASNADTSQYPSAKIRMHHSLENASGTVEYHIPDNVEILSRNCFDWQPVLDKIYVPKGVTHIPYRCFSHSSRLKSIVLEGDSLIVDDEAFFDCEKLQEIKGYEKVKSWGTDSLSILPNLKIDLYRDKTLIPEGGFKASSVWIR